jgi:hypothetical protein
MSKRKKKWTPEEILGGADVVAKMTMDEIMAMPQEIFDELVPPGSPYQHAVLDAHFDAKERGADEEELKRVGDAVKKKFADAGYKGWDFANCKPIGYDDWDWDNCRPINRKLS